jgi:2-polyprenyl-6-methoxyphenol hydroxylase-like FAD-dependent oxidoreductase
MALDVTAVVAGGGIGGLALGIALHRCGAAVTVVERTARIEDVGAGLMLYPNGIGALDAISARLGAAIRAAGHVAGPGETRPVLSPNGSLLAVDPVGDLQSRFGAPQVSLLRSAMQAALFDEATASGVPLRTGVRVAENTDHGDRVEIMLADGTRLEADLLVGADGIRSGVRRRLLDDGPPAYCGFTTLRGRAPAPPRFPSGFVVTGPGLDVFAAPIGGGHLYWTAKICAPAGVWPAKERTTALSDLLDLIVDWHSPVVEVIENTDLTTGIVVTDINDRDPIADWSRGRVTLLGDAAHPMTPAIGQGAGMALEDAVVLTQRLQAAGDVPAALAAYAAERAPRTAEVVRQSRRKGPADDFTGFNTQEEQVARLFGWRRALTTAMTPRNRANSLPTE